MRYLDSVYGEVDLEESVLLDLMQTQALQRLRDSRDLGLSTAQQVHHALDHAGVQQQLALISPATRFEWDEVNPTFRVSTKLRTIDLDVLMDARFLPLSTLDADFVRYRAEYLHSNSGKWPMRVLT